MADEQVKIVESGRALALTLLRASVAAVAAGAGALGTAAIGSAELEAGQYWAALGAAAAAFGVVIGVPEGAVKVQAPHGETGKIREIQRQEKGGEL